MVLLPVRRNKSFSNFIGYTKGTNRGLELMRVAAVTRCWLALAVVATRREAGQNRTPNIVEVVSLWQVMSTQDIKPSRRISKILNKAGRILIANFVHPQFDTSGFNGSDLPCSLFLAPGQDLQDQQSGVKPMRTRRRDKWHVRTPKFRQIC